MGEFVHQEDCPGGDHLGYTCSQAIRGIVAPRDRCRHYGGTGAGCSDCVAMDLEDQEASALNVGERVDTFQADDRANWPQDEPSFKDNDPSLDAYVVIYDHGAKGSEVEEYYGYFSSPQMALDQYMAMRAPGYRNANLCKIVAHIEDDESLKEETRVPRS